MVTQPPQRDAIIKSLMVSDLEKPHVDTAVLAQVLDHDHIGQLINDGSKSIIICPDRLRS